MKGLKGLTLAEAVLVIAIIAVLSGSGAYLMVYLIQNSVFIPNKLNMDMLAQEALDIMIEGDARGRGLRFARSVNNITPYQVRFNNQDNQSIRYRLDTGIAKLYRSINGSADSLIPYYLKTGINITAVNNALFNYYDANELVTIIPADVRRIKINLIAQTGTGSYANWEGQSQQSSSVALKRFQ